MGGWRRLLPIVHRHSTTRASASAHNVAWTHRSNANAGLHLLRNSSIHGQQSLLGMLLRHLYTTRGPLLSPSTDAKEEPVRSPLTMVPSVSVKDKKTSKGDEEKRPVRAILKKIKQSPKKVNLVAALVRGMRVEDALLQLTVLRKRAASTVKRVVANARANATHNHGLNGDRLFVAEAFVGKGKYLRRVSIHGKGKAGTMHHPSCRLTVIVKELSDKQEAELARYKTMHFRERAKFKSRLVPHKLIESTRQWHRTPNDPSPAALQQASSQSV